MDSPRAIQDAEIDRMPNLRGGETGRAVPFVYHRSMRPSVMPAAVHAADLITQH